MTTKSFSLCELLLNAASISLKLCVSSESAVLSEDNGCNVDAELIAISFSLAVRVSFESVLLSDGL